VHEDDVAQAIVAALLKKARGAYNLSANPCFSFRDAIIKRHRLAIPLPPKLAKAALNFVWRSTGIGGEIGWIDGANKSLTLDCSKAENNLNWEPNTHTHTMLFG
jgi:nucleoside-diphosphate-sugar epimerase